MTTLTAAQFARDAILLIACLPLAYYVVAMLAGLRFFFRQREKSPGSFTPEVSVLKPAWILRRMKISEVFACKIIPNTKFYFV